MRVGRPPTGPGFGPFSFGTLVTKMKPFGFRGPMVQRDYDVMPDGSFIATRYTDLYAREIRVIENWFDELRRNTPRN